MNQECAFRGRALEPTVRVSYGHSTSDHIARQSCRQELCHRVAAEQPEAQPCAGCCASCPATHVSCPLRHRRLDVLDNHQERGRKNANAKRKGLCEASASAVSLSAVACREPAELGEVRHEMRRSQSRRLSRWRDRMRTRDDPKGRRTSHPHACRGSGESVLLPPYRCSRKRSPPCVSGRNSTDERAFRWTCP